MDHEPAPWETSAPGPFLVVGEVALYALGGEREVEGFPPARELAHELAGV